MNERQRIQNFNKRWNIQVDEKKEFRDFVNRITYALTQILGGTILAHQHIDSEFAYLMGYAQPPTFAATLGKLYDLADSAIYIAIDKASDITEVVTALQYLFWVLEKYSATQINGFADEIRKAIALSPGVDIGIVQRGNRVTLYPGGAKLLDEAVVNEALEWLDQYPQVSKHFEEALRICQTKDVKKYRNLLDNLRVAVEQLLQALLKNRKTLENQKAPLAEWLEAHGVHKQVQNMYASMLFGPYAMYQNEAVKHGDKSSPVEVEYMIYLTGTFIRFLLQVSQETAHAA